MKGRLCRRVRKDVSRAVVPGLTSWLQRRLAIRNCSLPGRFHPEGVTMRDYSNNRGGFDRVLMAVAATFLTVSATSPRAQAPTPPTPAELAIDAAVPRPEPVNLPPPTINDFKIDTTASTAPAAEAKSSDNKSSDTKPDDVKPIDVTAPATTVPGTTMPATATVAPS